MNLAAEQALYAAVDHRGHDLVACGAALPRDHVRALLDEAMERLGDVTGPVRAVHVLPPTRGLWPVLRFEERRHDAAGRCGAPDVHALFFSARELEGLHPLLLDLDAVPWPTTSSEEPGRVSVSVVKEPRLDEKDVPLAAAIVERLLRKEPVVIARDEDLGAVLHLAVLALPPERRATLSVAERAFGLRRPLDLTVVPARVKGSLDETAPCRLGRFFVAAALRGEVTCAHSPVGLLAAWKAGDLACADAGTLDRIEELLDREFGRPLRELRAFAEARRLGQRWPARLFARAAAIAAIAVR